MKKASRHIIFIFAATMLLFILACQSNTPNSPISDAKVLRPNAQLNFLTAKNANFDKPMLNEQFINADEGGTVLVGDEETGYSSIHFMPGDLSEDVLITFSWDAKGHIAELSPHGLIFNKPVALNLSYANADVSEMVEDNIRIWYFDEMENAWELIGGEVSTGQKSVQGFIGHFSKYALAGGGD